MKKLLILTIFVCYSTLGFASDSIDLDYLSVKENKVEQVVEDNTLQTVSLLKKDCTVSFNVELENGTIVQGELTFSDVSWWDCTKMKFAAWWASTF